MFIELALPLLLAAQTGAEGPPTVPEIRAQARSLLESMCGAQCDVVDVKVKMRRVLPAGAAMPGFDDTPATRVVPGEIELALLFDAKLPQAYRSFVAERVKQRIGELGLPVLVAERSVPFPERPAPPDPPPPAAAPAEQRVERELQPVIIQPPAPPQPASPPAPSLGDQVMLQLVQALPMLLAFAMLAWLVLRVLSRIEALKRPGGQEEPAVEPPALTLTPEVIEESHRPDRSRTTVLPPSPDRLQADLRQHRGSTRRVFRRLLVRGEHETVARAVALLGDFVVKDLAHDPALREALAEAGHHTADILRAPMTDEESDEVLRSIQAELVADRVAHRADDVRKELEVLLGFGPEAFATIMRRLEPRLGLLLLRHAPVHLSESWLLGLAPEVRGETVRRLLAAPHAEPQEIEVLAETVVALQSVALVGGYEADHIVDLLDALPAAEQEGVVSDLEETRPDFVRRNLGQLPVESALLRVPERALGAAWASVPFEDWITYLRAAPPEIRDRAISTCPARLRDGLVEELALRVAPDPDRATDARRRIVRAALASAGRVDGAARALAVVERRETDAPAPGPSRARETKP